MGKELALAIGVNLSISRLGTVLNDLITPRVAIYGSIPYAMWLGALASALGWICGYWVRKIDKECEIGKNVRIASSFI